MRKVVSDNQNIEVNLKVFDDKGRRKELRKVPAVKIDSEVWVNPEAVVKIQLDEIALENQLKPRQLMLILSMYSPLGNFQGGFVFSQYHLNKILFYQWKELERIGLGGAFDRYTFMADKKGPVPKELVSDMDELSAEGVIEKTGGAGKHKTLHAKLTERGMKVAEKLWNAVESVYLEITKEVKDEILPLDPVHLKEKVHSEYPEFRTKYTELDE